MNNALSVKKKRNDITGLRAIAVVAVVIFHYSKTALPGGFVGVDVFFVISGFLMTSIIFNNIKNNSFNIISFIKLRAKRIFPALLVTVALVLILGYLFIAPISYEEMSKHSFASSLFVSNLIYASETGYFDTVSDSKFLLHTWSLSLEWQFYLIYPVIVLLLNKVISIERIKSFFILSVIVLFFISLYFSYFNAVTAYFSLYARAWEMLIGGLAFLYPINIKINKIKTYGLEVFGLLLIFISLFVIDEKTLWPGYMSLLPVLGAYLCLLAANEKTILGNFIFNKIGIWSYSIYLAHWPVLVFSKQLNLTLSFYVYIIIVLFISFLLYELVEKKRDYKYGLFLFFVAVLFTSGYFYYNGGAPGRISAQYSLNKDQLFNKYYGAYPFYSEANGSFLYLNASPGKADLILAGDSYSLQYLRFFSNQDRSVASVARTTCMIQPLYTTSDSGECAEMYKVLLRALHENPKADLILNQNWGAYSSVLTSNLDNSVVAVDNYINTVLSGLEDIVSRLRDDNKLFLVGTYSYPDYDVWQCLAGRELLGYKINNSCLLYTENNETSIDIALREFSNKYNNIYFISPRDALCTDNGCINYIEGIPIHFDGDHLSTLGAKLVGDHIISFVDKVNKK